MWLLFCPRGQSPFRSLEKRGSHHTIVGCLESPERTDRPRQQGAVRQVVDALPRLLYSVRLMLERIRLSIRGDTNVDYNPQIPKINIYAPKK